MLWDLLWWRRVWLCWQLTSKNHYGARSGEDNKIEKTSEGMKCICTQDGLLRDSVMVEGHPARNAVWEDTDNVYDRVAVQQVST